MMKKMYLYSAREIKSGKLVSNITNPGKKYWQQKSAAEYAVNKFNNSLTCRNSPRKLELVTWELTEVMSDNREQGG